MHRSWKYREQRTPKKVQGIRQKGLDKIEWEAFKGDKMDVDH